MGKTCRKDVTSQRHFVAGTLCRNDKKIYCTNSTCCSKLNGKKAKLQRKQSKLERNLIRTAPNKIFRICNWIWMLANSRCDMLWLLASQFSIPSDLFLQRNFLPRNNQYHVVKIVDFNFTTAPAYKVLTKHFVQFLEYAAFLEETELSSCLLICRSFGMLTILPRKVRNKAGVRGKDLRS